jgi:hypothetical protein
MIIYAGIMAHMAANVGRMIPETCAQQRKDILEEVKCCETAVMNIVSILAADMSGIEYETPQDLSPHGTAIHGGRSGGGGGGGGLTREKRSTSRDFGRNLYSGVWGGSNSHDAADKSIIATPATEVASTPSRDSLGTENVSMSAEEGIVCGPRDKVLLGLATSGLKAAGLKEVGFDANDLRVGGYTAGQLITAGVHIKP